MTNWIVVAAFVIATLSTALSAAAVAVAEPGAARVCAGLLSGVLLLTAVLGLSVDSSEGRARVLRQFLGWASKSWRRSGVTALGLCASAVLATWWGAGHTELLTVACLDARSISRDAVPGKRVESCAEDHIANFSVWYPWGRSRLLNNITCNYSSGESGDKIDLAAEEMSCPLRAFTYARPYKSADTWAWHRLLDGSWQERASSDGFYATFVEHGALTVTEYENCPTHEPISGTLVQRIVYTQDDQDMQLLIPRVLNKQARILERNKPTLPWRCFGVIVSVP